MDGAPETLTAFVIAGAFVASILAGIFLARRARLARQREFERLERLDHAPSPTDRKTELLRDLGAAPESEPEPAAPELAAAEPEPKSPAPEPPATPEPEADAPVKPVGVSTELEADAPVKPVGVSTEPARSAPAVIASDAAKPEPEAGALQGDDMGPPSASRHADVQVGVAQPSASALPIERPGIRASGTLGPATRKDGQRRGNPAAFEKGLARTRSSWVGKLGKLFAGKKEIDPQLVQEMERVLLTADIGVKTATRLLDEVRESLSKRELSDTSAVWDFLCARTIRMLEVESRALDLSAARPFVLLVVGVNGSGKTTTIGKLAARLRKEGKTVVLAAGDTFRAAAVEQLEVWAGRTGSLIVKGKEGADPASVLFEAVKRAQDGNIDVVIADTAGRLHTKTNLMDELQKVRRVIGKAMPGAPHETWLVVDATSGQNAIAQAQIFTQSMQVSGIVLTKLDGTAKGGVVLGIADQLRIPVRYVGVGEAIEDLREFDAHDFAAALFQREDAENTGAAA